MLKSDPSVLHVANTRLRRFALASLGEKGASGCRNKANVNPTASKQMSSTPRGKSKGKPDWLNGLSSAVYGGMPGKKSSSVDESERVNLINGAMIQRSQVGTAKVGKGLVDRWDFLAVRLSGWGSAFFLLCRRGLQQSRARFSLRSRR
jgi:hypothetical protein